MTGNTGVFLKVVEYLRKTTVPKNPDSPITLDTEVYYDLQVYGDDVFELVLWLNKEFGVEMNLKLEDYAPTEGGIFELRQILRRMIGKSLPQYKSLKVRDMVAAIEAKRWPDAAQANRT